MSRVAATGVLKLQIKEVGWSPSRAAAKKEDGRLSIWLPLSPPQGEAAPVQSGLHIALYLSTNSGITLEGIDVLRSHLGALLHLKAVIRWV